eukprot:12781725-Alexandrium_andersonii.AAC.1
MRVLQGVGVAQVAVAGDVRWPQPPQARSDALLRDVGHAAVDLAQVHQVWPSPAALARPSPHSRRIDVGL